MPIADVIRLAGHANHYLAVFDGATGSALDLFRTRRVASPAQRIMLIARDGGCTKPCCTVGAYGSQVHHADRDWADGGNTNVDELGLGLRRPTTAWSAPTAGPPGSTTVTKSNGSRHRTWTPVKPESTTTTNPNDYCGHPMTRSRSPTTTFVDPSLRTHQPRRSLAMSAAIPNCFTPGQAMTPIDPAAQHRPTTERPNDAACWPRVSPPLLIDERCCIGDAAQEIVEMGARTGPEQVLSCRATTRWPSSTPLRTTRWRRKPN